jgi:sec-independent protein translocase protein TatA
MVPFAFLGTPEIVVILVIALLVFGPQKLPEIGRQIGTAMRELRKMSDDVRRSLDIDDHGGYDRYDPPTYSYTPPVTTYAPPALDQVAIEDSGAPVEATVPLALEAGPEPAAEPVVSEGATEPTLVTEESPKEKKDV